MQKRRAAFVALAVLSAGAITTTGAAAQADSSPPPDVAKLPDSASLHVPAVATGNVELPSGEAVAGKPVLLMAWPSNDVTDRLVEGDRINMQPVARATTGSNGNFTLRIADNKNLREFAGKDGLVNFEIIASDGGEVSAHSFSRRLERGPDAAHGPVLTLPGYTHAAGSSANAAAPEKVQMALTLGSHPQGNGAPGATATAQDAPVMKSCSSQLQKNLGLKWVLVGQHYSTASYVATDFVYTNGASSSLGVAISANGSYGSWSKSGSISKSTTGSEDYPALHGKSSAYRDTYFKYGRYYVTCYEGYPGVASHYYETRPTSWAAGQRTRYPSAPAASKCVPQPKGSSFTKHTSQAVTWTNGADLSATIGIDLSTRTGYSGDAEVKFTFNRNRRLCGTGDYPGGTPYQLLAKMPA